jgi:hypothetical protein
MVPYSTWLFFKIISKSGYFRLTPFSCIIHASLQKRLGKLEIFAAHDLCKRKLTEFTLGDFFSTSKIDFSTLKNEDTKFSCSCSLKKITKKL